MQLNFVKSILSTVLVLALALLSAVEGKPSHLLDWHPPGYAHLHHGHEHIDVFGPHHYHHHHALPLVAPHHDTILPAAALPLPPLPPPAPLLHTPAAIAAPLPALPPIHVAAAPLPLPVPVPAAVPVPVPYVAPAPTYRVVAGPKISTHHVSLGFALPRATFSKVLVPAPLTRLTHFPLHHHHHALF